MFTRRDILAIGGTTAIAVLSGCGGRESRSVEIRNMTVKRENQMWLGKLELYLGETMENESEAAIHDITVLGYARNGQKVCSSNVGDLTKSDWVDDPKEVEITCSEFPDIITFSARESVCDGVTSIPIVLYRPERETWAVDRYYRECEEGLPPEPRE